jgi:hypothetical protein
VLDVARGTTKRRAIFLGLCAGLRNAELGGLARRHFARPGLMWVSADIAKGGRGLWVPVIPDLAPIVAEIREGVGEGEYVLQASGSATRPSTLSAKTYG